MILRVREREDLLRSHGKERGYDLDTKVRREIKTIDERIRLRTEEIT